MKDWEKREMPEKTRRPTASSCMIPTCENRVTRPGIEPYCWSHFDRGFVGVSVHWLDPASLHRKSAMLDIEMLTGQHTYDVLAAALDNILRDFEIQNKVTMCVTDSGSNFIKAFTIEQRQAWQTGDSRVNPPTSCIVRHDYHVRKSGATPPGIELGWPRWEASSMITTPPQPRGYSESV
ncbi:hypothetical protein PR048_012985 [Dryococelus australis]|uniref:Transposase n=1 Tax=Dryococelus australis TaxID=614101 RepID=A0ABQ9HQX0_9NEOP|nr:hypothetical protein PR048_012985 [Dryococelus australis]